MITNDLELARLRQRAGELAGELDFAHCHGLKKNRKPGRLMTLAGHLSECWKAIARLTLAREELAR